MSARKEISKPCYENYLGRVHTIARCQGIRKRDCLHKEHGMEWETCNSGAKSEYHTRQARHQSVKMGEHKGIIAKAKGEGAVVQFQKRIKIGKHISDRWLFPWTDVFVVIAERGGEKPISINDEEDG